MPGGLKPHIEIQYELHHFGARVLGLLSENPEKYRYSEKFTFLAYIFQCHAIIKENHPRNLNIICRLCIQIFGKKQS